MSSLLFLLSFFLSFPFLSFSSLFLSSFPLFILLSFQSTPLLDLLFSFIFRFRYLIDSNFVTFLDITITHSLRFFLSLCHNHNCNFFIFILFNFIFTINTPLILLFNNLYI
ncbi:hypothetical protein BCR41DRAFT_348726 [Lobosporangium transversale]|uniref:Uncharacterized protein n=1 Tax=Lobosporangium transversale TaxID=64571 RepID=A0A1Y2GXD9_9FUNG|nr:hypothetical protein BCR41DRAFT_348726 [Lobosporangium transversale]ORZ24917.1 hypothetical protein BCR41DRAFT_348726 [Lobosporangium transversale]|eukprot:XP_021883898.1 hypothetical protein BCR41DRAFT_348726 [Lobosporangium transversale]